ncbi:lipoprotein [uncultured Ramlibacter sp.]|uniref:LPS translocon maturation chaperone LptM n=1 Tax=uncultured Ramlibacter sp. TaxID=260755 RepID=UPI00261BBBE3|nr:lipoprotein [uncultured Ramlibacter sp.]
MLNVSRIPGAAHWRLALGAALLAALSACGQKGPLFLPTAPAAADRATLTETVRPGATAPASPASAPSTTGTASPVRTP